MYACVGSGVPGNSSWRNAPLSLLHQELCRYYHFSMFLCLLSNIYNKYLPLIYKLPKCQGSAWLQYNNNFSMNASMKYDYAKIFPLLESVIILRCLTKKLCMCFQKKCGHVSLVLMVLIQFPE